MSVVDAVLGYHLNPHTCGVAKFNALLAQRLGVPLLPWDATQPKHPLVSVKPSEVIDAVPDELQALPSPWHRRWADGYDLFLHSAPMTPRARKAVADATRVYAANAVIARTIATMRPDVVTAWCPSTVEGIPYRGFPSVLTFGMAHKAQTGQLLALKALLERAPGDYMVSVSCAIHEGSPWAQAWAETEDTYRDIFPNHVRILGFLGDDALAAELRAADAVALFYDPALRANNTTFWAALEAGRAVITNTDADSPELPTGAYNLADLTTWTDVRPPAQPLASTWPDLLNLITGTACAH